MIYTIGYEGIDIDDFLFLLKKHNINTIVDIRELPLSRKKGFSKQLLASYLNLNGYEYRHIPQLGCPKPIRNQYRQDNNWNSYKKGFVNHLETQLKCLDDLAELANTETCALLCFEADYNYCHRSLVASKLNQEHGLSVNHVKVAKPKTMKSEDSSWAFA
jgi:uncharacterized protein (DUF488 family)